MGRFCFKCCPFHPPVPGDQCPLLNFSFSIHSSDPALPPKTLFFFPKYKGATQWCTRVSRVQCSEGGGCLHSVREGQYSRILCETLSPVCSWIKYDLYVSVLSFTEISIWFLKVLKVFLKLQILTNQSLHQIIRYVAKQNPVTLSRVYTLTGRTAFMRKRTPGWLYFCCSCNVLSRLSFTLTPCQRECLRISHYP